MTGLTKEGTDPNGKLVGGCGAVRGSPAGHSLTGDGHRLLRRRDPAFHLPRMGGVSLRITNQRIWVIIGIITFSWGTSPIAVRIGLAEGIGPSTIAAGASLVATGAVWLMIGLVRRRNLVGPIELRIGLVLAFLSVVLPQQARTVALANASAGFVTLVYALVPIRDRPGRPHDARRPNVSTWGTMVGLLLGPGGCGGPHPDRGTRG